MERDFKGFYEVAVQQTIEVLEGKCWIVANKPLIASIIAI